MSHHRDWSHLINDHTLPTFLENLANIQFSVIDNDIVIELGEGTFTMDYNLYFHYHNITIKGQGRDKTKLIIPEDIDYIDDGIIHLQGLYKPKDSPISDIRIAVSIIGLTIEAIVTKEQAIAKSHRLTQFSSYLIKCYNVSSFVMRDVRIISENLATTSIDIRRGFNIDIRGCEFINNNRRWVGGNIWLRGDLDNVVIEDNDFYKYGNDEAIAIYDLNDFVGVNDSDLITKKDINIRFNRFYCQDNNGGANPEGKIPEYGDRGTWSGCNERFIACFTNQENNKEYDANQNKVPRSTPCYHIINGIHIDNNEFHINAPMSHLVTIAFDKYTTHKDVNVNNNMVNYGTWTVEGDSTSWEELMDFCVYYDTKYDTAIEDDYNGFTDEPFFIKGNTIICGSNIRNTNHGTSSNYEDNHICVDIKGTKVIFDDNRVICIREDYDSTYEQYYAKKGIELIHCGKKGGEAVLRNNHCEGLKTLARLTGSSTSLVKGNLRCHGNYLQGDTRIVHVNLLESHHMITNNDIISDYPLFFLEEFANTGTVIFTSNRVYRDLSRVDHYTDAFGYIYYTGNSGSNIQSMKLVCCDNIFNFLKTTSMYSLLQSSIMNVHKNNVFVNQVET